MEMEMEDDISTFKKGALSRWGIYIASSWDCEVPKNLSNEHVADFLKAASCFLGNREIATAVAIVFSRFYKNNRLGLDIDDFRQELYLKLIEKIKLYDRNQGPLKNWLCTVAKNHANNFSKATKKLLTNYDEKELEARLEEYKSEKYTPDLAAFKESYLNKEKGKLNDLCKENGLFGGKTTAQLAQIEGVGKSVIKMRRLRKIKELQHYYKRSF